MGGKERRRREREGRKNAILKSARKLFLDKGFKPITIEHIARKAELSKGAVYLYFKSKEEIYTQILLIDIEKFHKRLSPIFENPSSASEMLIEFSRTYVDLFLNDRELFRILMTFMLHTNHMKFSEEINNQLIRTTNRTVDVIEKILQYGIETGEFHDNLPVRQCRNTLWGLLNGIISLHLFTGKEVRREERVRSSATASLDIFLKGLKRTTELK